MLRFSARLVMLAAVLLTVGCTSGPVAPGSTPTPVPTPGSAQPPPRTALPADNTTVVTGNGAAELALATSRSLYLRAPAVVLAGEGDEASLVTATSAATKLGVPLLLTPGSGSAAASAAADLRTELSRLTPQTVVTAGAAATLWAQSMSLIASGDSGSSTPSGGAVMIVLEPGDGVALPDVKPAAPLDELLVLALDQPASRAATATARATGARVVLVANADPRTNDDVIKALAGQSTARVLALGADFGPADRLRRRIDTAATGTLLPGGGQVLFPGRRMVALYGHPGDSGLGSLGEQSLNAAITRARKVAASYSSLVNEPVVPAFEIIATVASSAAGADGNYSNESTIAQLRPWVDAAGKAGIYVVLDLQPGRTDFLTQAKLYTPLLIQPHVGLALDPEWRLKPGQRHLAQIGSVSAAEINKTAAWLADLTRQHKLPQKVLMLHQFRLDMITNRASVDTSYDELRVVIHADGFGTRGEKFNTWRNMHVKPPPNVWWGWKNFYDEDRPTFTPRQTVAVAPSPVFISYQ